MGRKKQTIPKPKFSHLTFNERVSIQSGLNEGKSLRSIAKQINKSPATVSREVQNHLKFYEHRANDCFYRRTCTATHICGSMSCNKKCHLCPRCANYCNKYTSIQCEKRLACNLKICNTCHRFGNCSLDKIRYEAEHAHKEYINLKSEARTGFDLTNEELIKIDNLVSPLIIKGLSPYSIKAKLGNNIPVSESTLRRMIDKCELEARNIHLRDCVKRKKRGTVPRRMNSEIVSAMKIGHLYSDYIDFISENDCIVCQMDCVEGLREENKVLLTLHFPIFHFQLAFIMDYHTSKCVVETLDLIEETLGKELYNQLFSVILTDNGHEFTDIAKMERSVFGGQRTRIFFCEPNRSDQKAECETNHKMIRYVLPKGKSFEQLVQPDISLIMSHINSYPRKSLGGLTPFEMMSRVFPASFFEEIGIDFISIENINLTPSLLKR